MELRRVAVELFERGDRCLLSPCWCPSRASPFRAAAEEVAERRKCARRAKLKHASAPTAALEPSRAPQTAASLVRALAPLRNGGTTSTEARADGRQCRWNRRHGVHAGRNSSMHLHQRQHWSAAVRRRRHPVWCMHLLPSVPDGLCGAACCGTDEVCIVKAGVTRCAQSCTTSSDCTVAMPCCSLLAPATGGSPPAKGACTSDTSACRCTTGSECSARFLFASSRCGRDDTARSEHVLAERRRALRWLQRIATLCWQHVLRPRREREQLLRRDLWKRNHVHGRGTM